MPASPQWARCLFLVNARKGRGLPKSCHHFCFQIENSELILWANLYFETSLLTTTKSSTLTPPEKLWMLSNTWRGFRTTVCRGSSGTCSTSTPTQKRLGKPSMPFYRSTVCDQKLPKELPTWTDLSAGVDNVTKTDNCTICELLQKCWTELCF